MPRAFCYACHKVQSLCLCAQITPVRNRTGLTIVQHPRERFHPLGTARIARLGLENCAVHVAWLDRGEPALPDGAALLFPSADASELESLSEREHPRHLVVLDGTWHHAHVLRRDVGWIARLPKVRLNPTHPGRYRIRREPAAHCLSTIEAVVAALDILEAETSANALLGTFERMIDHHVEAASNATRQRREKRVRMRPRRAIPPLLHGDNVIVAYGEFVSLGERRWPVQWVAERYASRELYERFVAPPGGSSYSARRLAHMGLRVHGDASSLSELGKSFAAFAGAQAVVVAWNQSTLDLLDGFLEERAERVLLKAVYSNLRRGSVGKLEDVVRRERLLVERRAVQGRAGERLANAAALLDLLRGAPFVSRQTG